ncbi:hypothetical protein ABZ860_36215 [Microbispora sp. NPDC046973]|uniref:hypothetical protein n=1 Tax=Microbispora sp. NPDC046973 TaxID=3155022 RepID=UPI0033E50045
MGINSRRLGIVGIVAAALLTLASCSDYPEQHQERLRKAAGVVTFQITCSKDLWERTRHVDYSDEVRAKSVKDLGNGVALVSLSGPQLVDYLKVLASDAYGINGRNPLSDRMYQAIAPEVDKIQGPLNPGDPIPAVTLNDAAVPAVSSNSVATPAARKSK